MDGLSHTLHSRLQSGGIGERGCKNMGIDIGDILVGLLVAVLGLVGLVMASGAMDNEIYIFGLSLAGFAVLFEVGLVRRHFDRADAARAKAGRHV
jgi:hypothetical protein